MRQANVASTIEGFCTTSSDGRRPTTSASVLASERTYRHRTPSNSMTSSRQWNEGASSNDLRCLSQAIHSRSLRNAPPAPCFKPRPASTT